MNTAMEPNKPAASTISNAPREAAGGSPGNSTAARTVFNSKIFPDGFVQHSDSLSKERQKILSCADIEGIIHTLQQWDSFTPLQKKEAGYSYKDQYKVHECELMGESSYWLERLTTTNPSNRKNMVVGAEDFYDCISEAHQQVNHKKSASTYNFLKQTYYGITEEDCKNFIALCPTCVTKQRKTKKVKGASTPIRSYQFRDRFQIDLIDMTSDPRPDHNGVMMHYILVIKDHFSKKMWLRALHAKEAILVAAELVHLFHEIGFPMILHNDNGTEFVNEEVINILRKDPLVHTVTGRPRMPSDQGSVERGNRDVQDGLESYLEDRRRQGDMDPNWVTGLGPITSALNCTYSHGNAGLTPYNLVYTMDYACPIAIKGADRAKIRTVDDLAAYAKDDNDLRTRLQKMGYHIESVRNARLAPGDSNDHSMAKSQSTSTDVSNIDLQKGNDQNENGKEETGKEALTFLIAAKGAGKEVSASLTATKDARKEDLTSLTATKEAGKEDLASLTAAKDAGKEDLASLTAAKDAGKEAGKEDLASLTASKDARKNAGKVDITSLITAKDENNEEDLSVLESVEKEDWSSDSSVEIIQATISGPPSPYLSKHSSSAMKIEAGMLCEVKKVMSSLRYRSQTLCSDFGACMIIEVCCKRREVLFTKLRTGHVSTYVGSMSAGKYGEWFVMPSINEKNEKEAVNKAWIPLSKFSLVESITRAFFVNHPDQKSISDHAENSEYDNTIATLERKIQRRNPLPRVTMGVRDWLSSSRAPSELLLDGSQVKFKFAFPDIKCGLCVDECTVGFKNILVRETAYYDYCHTETTKWWEDTFISAFGVLFAHTVHNFSTLFINSFALNTSCEPIEFDKEMISSVITVALCSDHFAVLEFCIEDRVVNVYDGLQYEMTTWEEHRQFCLARMGASSTEIDASWKFQQMSYLDKTMQLKQCDGWNCGPIACMVLWYLLDYDSWSKVGFPSLLIDESRRLIVHKMKEMLEADVDFLQCRVPLMAPRSEDDIPLCTICRGPMLLVTDDVTSMPLCHHQFHIACIIDHQNSSMSCPMCRRENVEGLNQYRTKEKRKEINDAKRQEVQKKQATSMMVLRGKTVNVSVGDKVCVEVPVKDRLPHSNRDLLGIVVSVAKSGSSIVSTRHGILSKKSGTAATGGGKSHMYLNPGTYKKLPPDVPFPDILCCTQKQVLDNTFDISSAPMISFAAAHRKEYSPNSPAKTKLSKCKCKGNCLSNRCSCKKSGKHCSSRCRCPKGCCNIK